jgi:ATP-dependent helicase HrpB
MAWIDPPPAPAMAAAKAALAALGALDGEGRITAHGRAMARLPMEPALAHMLLFAAQHGAAPEAARLALLLQERGLGGSGEDLARRYDRWRGDRSARAEASRKLAARWAQAAQRQVAGRAGNRMAPRWACFWPKPSPTASHGPARPMARNGCLRAGAATGSIRLRRW